MRDGRRAAAMMLVLLVTTFLSILGMSLLYFVERDSYSTLQLHREQKAEMLALAGINYARYVQFTYGPDTFSGLPPLMIPHTGTTIYNVDPDGLEQFEIWTDTSDTTNYPVHSLGTVKDSQGKVLARRELATPSALFGKSDYSKMNLCIWDIELP